MVTVFSKLSLSTEKNYAFTQFAQHLIFFRTVMMMMVAIKKIPQDVKFWQTKAFLLGLYKKMNIFLGIEAK